MSSNLTVVVLLAALTLASLVSSNHEEDFGFDISDDLEVELEGGQLRKWNDREIIAQVGKTFHLAIPKDAFEGKVENLEVKRHNGKGIPSWLLFDRKGGVFWGIPLAEDVGTVHLGIRSIGDKSATEELKIDVIESNEDSSTMGKCPANEDHTVLTLVLDKNIRAIKPKQRIIAVNNIAKFFGLPYSAFTLKPQLEKDDITDSSVLLAGPGNLHSKTSKVSSLVQVPVGCDGRLWPSTTPLVHQLKQQARDGTIAEVLRLPLIGWRVKTESKPVLREKRQASSTIDDYGSGDYDGEDEYDYEDYEEADDLGPLEVIPPSPKATVTLPAPTTTTVKTTTTASTVHPHRHHHGEVNPSISVLREHHQTTHRIPETEETMSFTDPPSTTSSTTTTEKATQPSTTPTTTSTTTTTTTAPTTATVEDPKVISNKQKQVIDYEDYNYDNYDDEEDNAEDPAESATIIPVFSKKHTTEPKVEVTESVTTESSATTKSTVGEAVEENIPITVPATSTTTMSTTSTTTSTTTTTEQPTTSQIIVETEPEIFYTTETEPPQSTFVATMSQQTTQTSTVATVVTTPLSSTTTTTTEAPTTEEETVPVKVTTVRQVSTTPSTTTTVREITEGIEHHENFRPFIENRLKQMSVIAGKIFRFVIPHNTFKDFEDEYNLTYELLDSNNKTVTNNTWLNFNAARREVYGLPLEEDVSKWVFWVRAYDSEGASEKEKLNIQVQQHKLDLVVNHEFSLLIRIEKHQEFPHYVDWSLKVLRALGRIYNTNMSEITVRHINYTNEPVIFTWSNDSIPTDYCPKTEIAQLYKTLTANDRGDPSRELNTALVPELRVKKVLYRELGVCEQPQTPVAPPVHPVTPPINFSPILRNPVDHVNATVGELLVYKVKDDTFYDPEDVDPRMLNISLLTSDRQPIPPNNWLQFDGKNREFFGIPRHAGRSEYHLVCVDSGGLPATDSLEVVVYPPLKKKYNVEFSMNITDVDFVSNAVLQKKFVEKLVRLFGESSPNNIHIHSFNQSYNSTIVTWFNKSLTTDTCPHEEINRLESMLRNMNDKSISQKVHNVMEPEFHVSTIKVHLINNCQPKITRDPRPEVVVPVEETPQPSSSDEYLITFIVPAVIITIMLLLAAIAACVLYRRRRTGKMNVEEDGRQSYGNKGIPVIFQEELEEKPEPGTKAPVILKDEKPPLAPPEYSKSGSVKLSDDSEPYQPPPPFTRTQDNGRQPRPKPTPTYRKPPPYVPP
ncbi:dystroglycan isoform X2 [Anoplophora glabripennis]|uniref:dystroglycan isoform X2 n=1 Tax=Anoplophora glabripennis TaxID=217634 RepID=UPI0008738B63|nr:dystroglycan isoform X2 [Anoplophora glabripennis]